MNRTHYAWLATRRQLILKSLTRYFADNAEPAEVKRRRDLRRERSARLQVGSTRWSARRRGLPATCPRRRDVRCRRWCYAGRRAARAAETRQGSRPARAPPPDAVR